MKTIHVVAAVIRDGDRIFATARGYGNYKGWWEFPGGKIEEGESPEEALRREVMEELASDIDVGPCIDAVEYDYPEFHLSLRCYWCRLISGNLELKEAADARWLTAETLDSVKWLPADLGLLEKIRKELQKGKTDSRIGEDIAGHHSRIKIIDRQGATRAMAEGEEEVHLFFSAPYQEGDRIVYEVADQPAFYWMQLDDAKGSSLVYVTGRVEYEIPFGEKRCNLSPKVFSGTKHLIVLKKARDYEYRAYRNLAFNVNDSHGNGTCFPHASANVETRGESVFAAGNAIDGVTVSESHGEWPYESWGINRDPAAVLRVEFGRTVQTDRVILYLRADFPHDSWWKQATLRFSDGSEELLNLRKTGEAQEFVLPLHKTRWVEFGTLVKAEDPSPFPALVQIEVYGTEA